MFAKRNLWFLFFTTFTLAMVFAVSPAMAISTQAWCEGEGAVWVGSTGDIGTCYFPPSHEYFTDESCDPAIHESYYESYNPGIYDDGCVLIQVASTSNGGGGDRVTNANNDETTTVNIPGGSATFPAGTCPQKCTVSSSLPGPAKNSLPGDAIATMYVRVVDEDGEPGNGSYTVCFENPDGDVLTIYRYISGVWTAIQIANTNPVCVSASGDGAFYLG